MRLPFLKARTGEVPPEVCKELEFKFHLEPKAVSTMRCATKEGHYAGRPVRYLRIFDPAMLPSDSATVRGYEDLATQKKALLFEGHIEKSPSKTTKGSLIQLMDRRSPKRSNP